MIPELGFHLAFGAVKSLYPNIMIMWLFPDVMGSCYMIYLPKSASIPPRSLSCCLCSQIRSNRKCGDKFNNDAVLKKGKQENFCVNSRFHFTDVKWTLEISMKNSKPCTSFTSQYSSKSVTLYQPHLFYFLIKTSVTAVYYRIYTCL